MCKEDDKHITYEDLTRMGWDDARAEYNRIYGDLYNHACSFDYFKTVIWPRLKGDNS